MDEETYPTIGVELANKMLRKLRGPYLGLDWGVFDADGNPDLKRRLFPGAWIVAENAYGYALLRVNEDLTLTEYVKEMED